MTAIISPVWAGIQFEDQNGNVLAGGMIYTYAYPSFTVQQTTYTDNTAATPNTNPIVLDANGRQSTGLYLIPNVYYNFKLTDSNNNLISIYESVISTECAFVAPGPPGGNTSCGIVPATPTLTWTTGTIGTYSIASYQIWRSLTEVGGYTQIGSVNSSTFTFTDSTALGSETYYYYIVAVDSQGNSSTASAIQSCTTPSSSPTIMLLHLEGANHSTVFTDSSTYNWTMGFGAGAEISTTTYEFAPSSLFLPGINASVDSPTVNSGDPLDFASGNFTIEGWVNRYYNLGGAIFGFGDPTDGFYGVNIVQNNDYTVSVYLGLQGSTYIQANSPGTLPYQTWTYFAVVCDGTNLTLYINGVNVAQTALTAAQALLSGYEPTTISWGTDQYDSGYTGFLDELRISNAALYSTNFSPPVARFPN